MSEWNATQFLNGNSTDSKFDFVFLLYINFLKTCSRNNGLNSFLVYMELNYQVQIVSVRTANT